MKIVLIANCHVQPLAAGLLLSEDVEEVICVPLHLIGTPHFDNPVTKINNSTDNYAVLQFPNSLEKIDFHKNTLRRFDLVKSFTNIYFDGLHPDMAYFGGMGQRIISPLGDYHSKICLAAFAKSYSVADCKKLFNGESYSKLGFYDSWMKSEEELLRRDEVIDIKFAREFIGLSRENITLFTFNHPLPIVFAYLLKHLYSAVGLAPLNLPHEFFYNFLSSNAWWPVYDEIGRVNSIKYRTPQIFKSPDNQGGKVMNLEDFISNSYISYAKIKGIEDSIKLEFQNIVECI